MYWLRHDIEVLNLSSLHLSCAPNIMTATL